MASRFAPALGLALLAAAGTRASAAPLDFASFVAGLPGVRIADVAAAAKTPALDPARFEEARSYLQRFYAGMTVRQTVQDEDSRVLDCIRYDQQPALHLNGPATLASAPAFPPRGARAGDQASLPEQPLLCAAGTFPIQRLTLERIMKAGSLRAFFAKEPGGRADGSPRNSGGHAYAFAYQSVTSYGGQSTEGLYKPKIKTDLGEIFSLEQQWYIGGSGAGTQTAEVGWQEYPALYGTPKSVLFAYYTADDYNQTGCYNYDCGAFVQLANAPVSLAVPFKKYSKAGGKQVPFTIGYQLVNGRWYLSYGGAWVGYYPGSVYNGGQLATKATLFELGTETVGRTVWPPAASGKFAEAGYPEAGYQFDVSLFNADGSTFTPSLTKNEPSPSCYTASTPGPISGHGYGFLLGGPGGKGC